MKCFWVFIILVFAVECGASQELSILPGLFGLKYYCGGERVTKKQVNEMMKTAPLAYTKWDKSNDEHLGALVSGSAMLLMTYLTMRNSFEGTNAKVYAYGSIGFGVVTIILELSSISDRNSAILDYNKLVTKGQSTQRSLSFEPSKEGIGVTMKF